MNSTLLQPASSSDIAIFEPRERRGPRLDERVFIYAAPSAQCIDICGTALVKMYAHKLSEAAKWRANWDRGTHEDRVARAAKCHQRRGHGTIPWAYGKDPVPLFIAKKFPEIESQVAELLDFANDRCYVPDTFWLNETAKQAAGAEEKIEVPRDKYTLEVANDSDPRLTMVLRLVPALYDKPYCSFVVPRAEDERRSDCFYFPENSAFLDFRKVTGLVAAVMMSSDPQANLGDKPMQRGRKYLEEHPLMICDQGQPAVFLAELRQRVRPPAKARVLAIMPPVSEDSELDQMD